MPSVRLYSLAHVPLVALVGVVAFFELLFNRLSARMLGLEVLQPQSLGVRLLDDFGLFTFELLSALAVLTMAAGLWRVAFSPRYRPGARASFTMTGGVCVALSAYGVLFRLSPQGLFQLHLSFTFFALVALLASLASPAELRHKLGTLLLLLPILLRFLAELFERGPLQPQLVSAGQIGALAEVALVVAAIASALCFVPRRGSFKLPGLVAGLLMGGGAALVRFDWEGAARAAQFGFGVELPMNPWVSACYLLALGTFAFAVASLLASSGAERLRGYGLMVLGVGGLQLELPYQVATAGVAFLCLVEAALRSSPNAVSPDEFRTILKHLAGVIGSPQVVVSGRAGYEVARIHSPPPGTPLVSVTVTRRAAQIHLLEIVVGEAPPREPPLTIERKGEVRLGPRAPGAPVATDDRAFDELFTICDRRGVGAMLFDEPTRAAIAADMRGWIGIWPQRGACYRSRLLPDGEAATSALVNLMRQVAARTA